MIAVARLWLESARLVCPKSVGSLLAAQVWLESARLLDQKRVLGRPVALFFYGIRSALTSVTQRASVLRCAVVRRSLPSRTKSQLFLGGASVLPLAKFALSILQARYCLETRLQQRDGSVACITFGWERLGPLRQAITKNTAALSRRTVRNACVAAQVDTQVDLATNSYAA